MTARDRALAAMAAAHTTYGRVHVPDSVLLDAIDGDTLHALADERREDRRRVAAADAMFVEIKF
jgi:hypothetical protein